MTPMSRYILFGVHCVNVPLIIDWVVGHGWQVFGCVRDDPFVSETTRCLLRSSNRRARGSLPFVFEFVLQAERQEFLKIGRPFKNKTTVGVFTETCICASDLSLHQSTMLTASNNSTNNAATTIPPLNW